MDKHKHQQRYIKHQARKKKQLIEAMPKRRSQRVFNGEPLTDEELDAILSAACTAPSSCNRRGMTPTSQNGGIGKKVIK